MRRELVTTEDPDLARKLLVAAFEPRPIKAAA
jgi:hypothetical protein